MDLEEIWRQREENVYPSLFGNDGRGIFPLSAELFSGQFKQTDIDPRWLFLGVFEFPPTAARPSWLYVTSGHSNPLPSDAPTYTANTSGTGVEFIFQSSEQGNWAIRTLQSIFAFDLLLRAGRFAGKPSLGMHDRIPLHAPINGDPSCVIRNLVIAAAPESVSGFSLPSGPVSFLSFTGVTDPELGFAKSNGTSALVEALAAAGYHPVTNPHRASLK